LVVGASPQPPRKGGSGKKGKIFPENEALIRLAETVSSEKEEATVARLAKATEVKPAKQINRRKVVSKLAGSPRLRDAKARLLKQTHDRQIEKRLKAVGASSSSNTAISKPKAKTVSFG